MSNIQITENLTFTKRTFPSKEEAIKAVSQAAVREGYVLPGFEEDLLKREKSYPTGMDTTVPSAMPHVGTSCVTSFLSLTTLSEPLEFGRMGGEGTILVELMFVFGVIDPDEEKDMFMRFVEVLQDRDTLERLKAANSDPEACTMMQEIFANNR